MIDTNRYRSGLEREGARQLKLAGVPFEFETVKIDYLKPAKKAKYNPDFVLWKLDGSPMYIEFKGRFLTADRQKHLLIKTQYPDIDIRFVFQRASEKIGKGSNTTYAKWAEDKGFKWADKGKIPKEWLAECSTSKPSSAKPERNSPPKPTGQRSTPRRNASVRQKAVAVDYSEY